jgi:hypothetical protein
VAERFRNEFEEARRLVESVLGEGWVPTGRHYLVTHDEEELARAKGGPGTPAATVITAEKDGVRRHVAIIGDQRECDGYEDGFGEMLTEPDPKRTFTHKGQELHVHKYSLYWAGYETEYAPKSAEELATARGKREEKAEAKWQAEVEKEARQSLFPDFVREQAEEARKQKKGRKR